MSDSEASVSPATSSASGLVGNDDVDASISPDTSPRGQWSAWDFGATDLQPVEPGIDLMSSDSATGEWFPSVPAVQLAALTLAVEPDSDPLVDLPPSEFALHEGNLDDGYAFASTDAAELTTEAGHGQGLHTLMAPAGYGAPLDHIEWHFTGLLPLV
jgi:hypothetical protein